MHVIEEPILFLYACVCMWLFITQRGPPKKILGLKSSWLVQILQMSVAKTSVHHLREWGHWY